MPTHLCMAVAINARKPIPAEAMRFSAEEVEFSQESEGSPNQPISLLARSNKPVSTWFWGNAVHDLSGMNHAKKIPIDYCHDDTQILGFVDKFSVTDQGLKLDGMLTPSDNPNDMCRTVTTKQKAGVPYQASIFFDPNDMVIEQVRGNETAEVNGYKFKGPGIIFRKWTLRGVAVCPYGKDANTSSSVKFDATQFSVSMISGGNTVAEENETPEVELEETGTPEVETPASAAPEASPKMSDKPKGKKPAKDGAAFLTAFGDKGGVWFAQGKTFEEAQALFTQGLRDENTELKAKVVQLEAQVTALRGEKEPIEAELSDKDKNEDKKIAELAAKMGSPSAAKGALGIKLPV